MEPLAAKRTTSATAEKLLWGFQSVGEARFFPLSFSTVWARVILVFLLAGLFPIGTRVIASALVIDREKFLWESCFVICCFAKLSRVMKLLLLRSDYSRFVSKFSAAVPSRKFILLTTTFSFPDMTRYTLPSDSSFCLRIISPSLNRTCLRFLHSS